VDKTKVYSPNQVFAASIAGGPGAMVYVLWKNFKALENPDGQKQILIWGAAFLALLLIALPFLPIGFPNYVLPIAYAVAARFSPSNIRCRSRRSNSPNATNSNPIGTSSASASFF
jgi:hypothetical protein